MKNVMDRVYPFLFRPASSIAPGELKALTMRDIVSMLHLYGGLPELLELSERATERGVPPAAPVPGEWTGPRGGSPFAPAPKAWTRRPGKVRHLRGKRHRNNDYRKELGAVEKDGVPQTPGGLFLPEWGLKASRPMKHRLTVDEIKHLHQWWRDKAPDLTQFQRDILFFWLPPNGFPKSRGMGIKEIIPRVVDHEDEVRWKAISPSSKAAYIGKNIRQMIRHLRRSRKEQGL